MESAPLCLDTSVLIAFLKGREPGAGAVARAQKAIGEEALLGVMLTAPFDDAAAHRAAKIHDHLIRQNTDIGIKDVLIAAISLERELSLLTLNERHFARVPDLIVLTPEAFLIDNTNRHRTVSRGEAFAEASAYRQASVNANASPLRSYEFYLICP